MLAVKPGEDLGYTLPQRIRRGGCGEEHQCLVPRPPHLRQEHHPRQERRSRSSPRFKRERLAPGEMEHIALPRVLLDKAPVDEADH